MQMKMGNCAYSYSYRCERCIQQTETVAELKLNFPGSTYIYATLRRSLWSSNWKCEKGKRKKGRWLCPANEQLIDKRQRQCVCVRLRTKVLGRGKSGCGSGKHSAFQMRDVVVGIAF